MGQSNLTHFFYNFFKKFFTNIFDSNKKAGFSIVHNVLKYVQPFMQFAQKHKPYLCTFVGVKNNFLQTSLVHIAQIHVVLFVQHHLTF